MNVMLVAVSQRTSEIGLLKALGASGREIVFLILIEALLLSSLGGLIGLIIGHLGAGEFAPPYLTWKPTRLIGQQSLHF